jgi:hypothetical protein
MNSTVSLLTTPALAVGQLNCHIVNVASGELGFGRYLVPNKDVGQFLALAHWLVSLCFDNDGNISDSKRRDEVSLSLAEHADELCTKSNITY